MKCFEMLLEIDINLFLIILTVNMKCFEIKLEVHNKMKGQLLTVNMKCFEIRKVLSEEDKENN